MINRQCFFRVVEFLAIVDDNSEVKGNRVVLHVTYDNHPDCEKYILTCERKIIMDDAESEFKIERIWR